ncbi:hypothetical protein A33Q_1301 [Indibacter alkaliphilus LW1]|uniref:Uncharacterized protein n=1 Tax=Indibacter alkaliphilus (strain CCUG 57479 / KCTC 22604 / LW1) TaxID=1189612 RepID=S2DI13_INDAL|nr:hypothetical protein A33Q_1301 [Indibacter alkaliphilus LW1]
MGDQPKGLGIGVGGFFPIGNQISPGSPDKSLGYKIYHQASIPGAER